VRGVCNFGSVIVSWQTAPVYVVDATQGLAASMELVPDQEGGSARAEARSALKR
jgi:hypothetical protein